MIENWTIELITVHFLHRKFDAFHETLRDRRSLLSIVSLTTPVGFVGGYGYQLQAFLPDETKIPLGPINSL